MSISREQLTNYLESLYQYSNYPDYGPNGLQIEGSKEIKKIGFSVSATRDSIQMAVDNKCDTLIVHHGLFWHFHGVKTITGDFSQRISPLIKNNINLYGFHLPLDAHKEIGNASGLAHRLGLINCMPFGNYKGFPTGIKGQFPFAVNPQTLITKLEGLLNHQVIWNQPPHSKTEIETLGIITGGANGDWILAKKEGLDAYLSGEMREHDWHESREANIHFFAGGHHATEQFGVMGLKSHLENKFNLECQYFSSHNPT